MIRSKYCSLQINQDYNKKDCEYDPGGYFIVNGSEKFVLSMEKMVENKPLVFIKKDAGFVNYKVKINFDGKSMAVKSGMTANVNITTAKKDNVLIAPLRAVIEKIGSDKFARLLVGEEIKEVPVTIGLRGDDGLVEILSGLNENDLVVTYIQQSK